MRNKNNKNTQQKYTPKVNTKSKQQNRNGKNITKWKQNISNT
jgi:hypothetical protein